MNSGNKKYHMWVMLPCPDMVAEYLEYREGIYYDIVQLLVALNLNIDSTPTNHGQMTGVIWYHAPFFVNNRDSLI